MYVPTGFVNQAELGDAVAQAAKALDSREVRDVRCTLARLSQDWSRLVPEGGVNIDPDTICD